MKLKTRCEDTFSKHSIKNSKLIMEGVYSRSATLCFSSGEVASGTITDYGADYVKVDSIDNV